MKNNVYHAFIICLLSFIQVAAARVFVAPRAIDDKTSQASEEKLARRDGTLPVATDESFNNGAPFKVLIQQVNEAGWNDDVIDYYWLMPNGNTTTNCTRAARYRIQEGKLHIAGKIISTDIGVLNMAFEPRLDRGEVTTEFFVRDGLLNWTSPHFTEGVAQFYKLPPGLLENALILSKFVGPMQPKRGWSPIKLNVKPNTICDLLDDDDIEVSNSTAAEDEDSGEQTGDAATVSSTGVSKPTSSSTTALSVDGRCGSFNGRTCSDSDFGDCCNEYGYCGRFEEYCGAGCQPSFGLCDLNGPLTSSSIASSPAENASSIQTSLSTTPTSRQSSTPEATSSAIASSTSADGAFSAQRLSPNGRCGANGNYSCARSGFGDCCSYSGYCGNTTAYCSAGCQSDYGLCEPGSERISVDGSCGIRNNMTCSGSSFGECCSSSGYCGNTIDYCGTGCDAQYGTCQNVTSSVVMERGTMVDVSVSSVTSSFSSYTNTTLTTASSAPNNSSLLGLTNGSASATRTDPMSTGTFNETSSASDTAVTINLENWSTTYVSSGMNDLATTIPGETASAISSNNSSWPSTQATDPVTPELSSSTQASFRGNETVPATEPITPTPVNTSIESSEPTISSSSSASVTPALSSTLSTNYSSTTSSSSTIGSTLYHVASATPVMGDLEGNYFDTDDDYGLVTLPFEMQLFGQSSNQVFPSTNGVSTFPVLQLKDPSINLLTFNIGSAEFRNVELPTTNIPVLSIAPLWDDFFLTGGSYQGVFYQLGPNNQSVIFEYRLRRAGVPESLYQFQLLYDLASPGVVVFRYFATAETGGMSTIGIQGYPEAVQYSFSQKGSIEPGVEITCNTKTSICARERFSLAGKSIL